MNETTNALLTHQQSTQNQCAAGTNVPPASVTGTKRGFTMIDFASKPVRQQAVLLNRVEVIIRLICYTLAQKGDPSVDQQTARRP